MEGVPVWLKAVAYRKPKPGEHFIDLLGQVDVASDADGFDSHVLIVEPNNPYGVYDLHDVPVPEGYERNGNGPEAWYRPPQSGEYFLSTLGMADLTISGFCEYRIILRPIRKTRRVLVVPEIEVGIRDSAEPVVYFGEIDGPLTPIPYRIEERDS